MKEIIIIGGGPAGLMAAEVLAQAGCAVSVFEQKPTLGRKLQMAGRGGLNITHSEPLEVFLTRYGEAASWLKPVIEAFPPQAVRAWCLGLGEATFIGSSGRVFPEVMKAAPLLRAWQARLVALGVTFHMQHQWCGWQGDALRFLAPQGEVLVAPPAATLLALGGASWPRLGSDAAWVPFLLERGVKISPFRPANCGFKVAWSPYFQAKYAGQPLKPVSVTVPEASVQGEVMITATGIEGGAIYALSRAIRTTLEQQGRATLTLDLKPSLTSAQIEQRLGTPYGGQSFSTRLRKCLHLSPVMIGLLQEDRSVHQLAPAALAARIKAYPLVVEETAGIERAISSAGGIAYSEITPHFELKTCPRVFVAGEMIDWEAPTGGYLLQACLSMARAAADGVLKAVSLSNQ